MKSSVVRFALALTLLGAVAPVVHAEEGAKSLPTLVIKGEVVSVDSSDPAASILKVKDRYGFETPIHLTAETKIAQGEQAVDAASLVPGSTVEVEYSFDINTAKRHAVRVSVSAPAAPAPAAAGGDSMSVTTQAEVAVSPEASPAPAESAAAPEPAASAAPAEPPAAPAY